MHPQKRKLLTSSGTALGIFIARNGGTETSSHLNYAFSPNLSVFACSRAFNNEAGLEFPVRATILSCKKNNTFGRQPYSRSSPSFKFPKIMMLDAGLFWIYRRNGRNFLTSNYHRVRHSAGHTPTCTEIYILLKTPRVEKKPRLPGFHNGARTFRPFSLLYPIVTPFNPSLFTYSAFPFPPSQPLSAFLFFFQSNFTSDDI